MSRISPKYLIALSVALFPNTRQLPVAFLHHVFRRRLLLLQIIHRHLYCRIHQYSNRLDADIKIDEKILSCYTIKLLLQPIVENSIYHGLELKKGMGTIRVNGYQRENEIIFEIEDNGIGIKFDQLNLLMETLSMESDRQESRSIGLKNVYDRIKYYFGAWHPVVNKK